MATPTSAPARSRPAVDEWGLYDPEQAGLSALFVKLADTKLAHRDPRAQGARAAAQQVAGHNAEEPTR